MNNTIPASQQAEKNCNAKQSNISAIQRQPSDSDDLFNEISQHMQIKRTAEPHCQYIESDSDESFASEDLSQFDAGEDVWRVILPQEAAKYFNDFIAYVNSFGKVVTVLEIHGSIHVDYESIETAQALQQAMTEKHIASTISKLNYARSFHSNNGSAKRRAAF
jgi:hypothetical protein